MIPRLRAQRPGQASTRPGRGAPNLGLARHLDPSFRACHVWVVRGRDRVVPIPVKVMADQNTQLLARLAQLAALTDAVTRLRENQDRAAQAAAARRAAEQLRLTAAQRATAAPGGPAATATRSRQPGVSSDLGRPGPGPVQGSPDSRRGPRR